MNYSTTYKNRYGDKYIFTECEDGTVLWEGPFNWCRFSCPNVYTEAYKTYLKDGGGMDLDEFEEELHRAVYDENGDYKEMSEISKKYGHLVYSDTSKIDMIDPSGGPYICVGMDLEDIDTNFSNKIVKEFKKIETGYKIITE